MVEKSRKTVGMRRSVRVAYENRSAKLVVSARLTKFCPLFRHTSRRQGGFFAYGLRNLTVGAPRDRRGETGHAQRSARTTARTVRMVSKLMSPPTASRMAVSETGVSSSRL